MTSPCLILDITEAGNWPNRIDGAYPAELGKHSMRIPLDCRPTVLQPTEKIAIEEARRLALAYPARRFAIFQAKLIGMAWDVPSHITVGGQVFATSKVARIVELGEDDGIPF